MKNKTINVDCPMKNCREMAIVEVNADLDDMTEQERKNLIMQVKKRIQSSLRKHHIDGHPKGEGK